MRATRWLIERTCGCVVSGRFSPPRTFRNFEDVPPAQAATTTAPSRPIRRDRLVRAPAARVSPLAWRFGAQATYDGQRRTAAHSPARRKIANDIRVCCALWISAAIWRGNIMGRTDRPPFATGSCSFRYRIAQYAAASKAAATIAPALHLRLLLASEICQRQPVRVVYLVEAHAIFTQPP
jgi:hypothetical protein